MTMTNLQEGPHEMIPSALEVSFRDLFCDAVDEAAERDELTATPDIFSLPSLTLRTNKPECFTLPVFQARLIFLGMARPCVK